MPIVDVPFVGPEFPSRSKSISAQAALNIYPELNVRAGEQQSFIGAPALRTLNTLNGPCRALQIVNGVLTALFGNNLYSVDANFVESLLGNIPGTGRMYTTETTRPSGKDGVYSNGSAFLLSGTTLVELTDPDLPQVDSVTFQDGYVVFAKRNSTTILHSDLEAFTEYSPLAFADEQSTPRNVTRVLSDHRENLVFKEDAIIPWQNNQATPFTFERVPGVMIERGCKAPHTIQQVDNTVFWWGDDGIVYRMDDRVPTVISTHALTKAIGLDFDGAFGWTYTQEGHVFYGLANPNWCYSYDVATGEWHQRRTWGRPDYVVTHVVAAYNKVIGGTSDGRLVELDLDFDDGEIVEKTRATTTLDPGQQFILHEVELIAETGFEDAEVELWVSPDRGNTWEGPVLVSINQGYDQRVLWPWGGLYETATFRVRQTDSRKTIWVKLRADIESLG